MYMKPVLQKTYSFINKHIFSILYVIFLILLFIKFLLVSDLSVRSAQDFLETGRYLSSDSYDCFANGLRLFESREISYRQPGYPIIIMLLDFFKVFFLHNLLNSLALFAIIYSVIEILRYLKIKKSIIVVIALLIFGNGNIQTFAIYALSDIYAIALYSLALLFYVKGSYKSSFLLLGISALFQYFALIAAVPQFLHWLFRSIQGMKFKNVSASTKLIRQSIILILLTILPNIPWLIYRAVEFGDPFYSNVSNFSLLSFNFDSLFFYLINSYSMFGLLLPIFVVGITLIFSQLRKNINYSFLLLSLLTNFVFWILMYGWNDRRFLLYFIPVIYVVSALALDSILQKYKTYLVILLVPILLYPAFYTFDDFFNSGRIPIIHRKELNFASTTDVHGAATIKPDYTFKQTIKYELENIPYISSYIHWYQIFKHRHSENPQFTQYSEIIDNVTENKKERTCLISGNNNVNFDYYVMNSLFLINEGKSISTHNKNCVTLDNL